MIPNKNNGIRMNNSYISQFKLIPEVLVQNTSEKIINEEGFQVPGLPLNQRSGDLKTAGNI